MHDKSRRAIMKQLEIHGLRVARKAPLESFDEGRQRFYKSCMKEEYELSNVSGYHSQEIVYKTHGDNAIFLQAESDIVTIYRRPK